MHTFSYYANPIALGSFLTALYVLAFACWGFALNPRARPNQSFFLMGIHALVWNLGIGFMLCSQDPSLAERWYRVSFLGVVFISPGVFFFTSAVTHNLGRQRAWIAASYGLALGFGLEGWFGKGTISGMWEYPWGYYPRYGTLGLVFLAFFLFFMVASFRNLVRGLRTAPSGLEKRQIRSLLVAFMIAYLGATDFVPCFGVPNVPMGFVAIISFATVLFWSMYRYQLLNPTPESLAREVLATIADSIIALDEDGFVRLVNPKAGELLGYGPGEMLHRHFSGFVDPTGVDSFEKLFQSLLLGGRDVEAGVITLRSKEGESIPTACNLSAIRGWKGQRQGVVLACRDLKEFLRTRRLMREQEESLRESQERYNALFDRSLYCVYLHDFEGRFLDANDAALRLLGYSREEIGSLSFASLIDEDQVRKALLDLEEIKRRGRTGKLSRYKLQKKDGRFVWVETEACVIYRQGRPFAVQGIALDITERVQAEEALRRNHERLKELVEARTAEIRQANEMLKKEISERIEFERKLQRLNEELDRRVQERTAELERANEELKELDKMKDAFLSSVSHELRTPLTSIRSFSEILLRYEEEEPETRREFLEIINMETERLTRLINDVLDLSRMEAGQMVWHDGPVRLHELASEVARVHRGILQGKSLRLEVDVPSDLPPVLVDRDRIYQVITNLVANAVRFSGEGGTIRIHAEPLEGPCSEEPADWIVVSVSDQGIGIDEKDLDVIFDKFRQVSTCIPGDKPGGTGLGLPISREIVVHYGGNIWVRSRKGEGSTFFFTLPTVSRQARHAHGPVTEKSEPARGKGMKVRSVA